MPGAIRLTARRAAAPSHGLGGAGHHDFASWRHALSRRPPRQGSGRTSVCSASLPSRLDARIARTSKPRSVLPTNGPTETLHLMTVTLDTILVRDGEPISATVNEDVVVLSMRAGSYFGFNRVGSEIWNTLSEPRRVDQIFDALSQSYAHRN